MVRMPGICNCDPATTVLAHLNGGGMALKRHDLHGAWCCSACHDEADRRTRILPHHEARMYLLDGVIRTQEVLIQEGVLVCA